MKNTTIIKSNQVWWENHQPYYFLQY